MHRLITIGTTWTRMLLVGISAGVLVVTSGYPVYAAPISSDPNYSVSLLTSGLLQPANGLVFRPTTNDLLVSGYGANKVLKVDASSGAVGFFASVTAPDEMAINSLGEVFVKTHSSGGPINRFDSNGNLLGSFTPFSGFPTGIAFDVSDNFYIAESTTNTIWKFAKGTFTSRAVFASGLPNLEGIAFSPSGKLFATDENNGKVYQVTQGGTTIDSHILWASDLLEPRNFAFDLISGDLFFGDWSGRIFRSPAPGTFYVFATGFSKSSGIYDLDFDTTGNLYVDDFTKGEVWKFTRTGDLGPTPFLDLPWDYESQRKSFEDVVFNPVSWFDHKYPLQNLCCDPQVMNYTGKTIDDLYRSHNGYDYGLKNGVELNTPVLAAADGLATFKPWQNTGGAGNVIKIDHGNSYQTWYEHLSSECVLLCEESKKVFVNKGQVIGKVGMTGNTSGPHIHFSVFKDIDKDGSFEDEIPFGVVDPLGWEGESTDPWTEWTDGIRKGTKSFNLFIPRTAPKSMPIPTIGNTLIMDAVQIAVPSGALSTDFTLTIKNGPFEFVSDTLKSIVPSFFLDAVDSFSQKITEFLQPIKITYNYANSDLFNINEDTLKLYSFNEQTNQWEALASTLNKDNKIITGETTHFSQFALMGEVKDQVAPTTEAIITGDKGQNNWYRSNIKIELNAKDNDGGVGLQYTLYTLNDNDWLVYESPLIFDQEGSYEITYQSYDKAENKEEQKIIEFNIDKTPSEARIFIGQDKQDLVVEGIDHNQPTIERLDDTDTNKKDDAFYIIADQAGNTIKLDVKDRDKEKNDKFRIYSIQYNQDFPIELPDNKLIVEYKSKKDKLSVDEQRFEIKGEVKIRIKYNSKKNQSTITTKEVKEEKVKEIKEGLILLQLTTNQGNLEYSY